MNVPTGRTRCEQLGVYVSKTGANGRPMWDGTVVYGTVFFVLLRFGTFQCSEKKKILAAI